MAETIKTILTADATAYEAGFRRGGNALSAHLTKEKEFFARSIAGHQDQIRALKLQADGYTNLAQSLTQTLSIEKEARKLAASGLITEEKAIAMLREKQVLQGQIAAQAAAQAAEQAAARQKAMELQQSEKALILEAAQAEKRMQADIRARYEAQSNAILEAAQAARRAEKEAASRHAAAIANPRKTGLPGGGGELAPLTPQSLQMIDRAVASQRELHRQTLRAGQSGQNASMGFLAFSQAVEDAQYGIRGVLNNLPQMVMGFGGSMGLAGALSIAAVAAVALYPALREIYGAVDNERVKAAAANWAKLFKQAQMENEERRRGEEFEENLVALSEQLTEHFRKRLITSTAMGDESERQANAAAKQLEYEKEILLAKQQLDQSQGGSGQAISTQIRELEAAAAQAELNRLKEEENRITADLVAQNEVLGNISEERKAKEIAQSQKLKELRDQLNIAEKALQAGQAEKEAFSGQTSGMMAKGLTWLMTGGTGLERDEYFRKQELKNLEQNTAIYEKAVRSLKREIEQLAATQGVWDNAAQAALQSVNAQIAAREKETQKTADQRVELEKLIEQRKKLQAIEEETRKEQDRKGGLEFIRENEKANEELILQREKEKEDRQKIIDQQNAAKAEFAAELMVLQLRRDGQSDLANALEKENALRKQALDFSKAAGITEEQALESIKKKLALEKEIERIRGGLPVRSRLRQEEREAARAQRREDARQRNAAAGGIAEAGRRGEGFIRTVRGFRQNRGLENAELIRREAERRQAAAGKDPVAPFWEKQLDLQERLVAHFDKLVAI